MSPPGDFATLSRPELEALFSVTLTTQAFDPRRLRRFATCSCKPIAGANPHLSRRLLRHTNVRHPELVRPVRGHVLRKIGRDRAVMVAVRSGDVAALRPHLHSVVQIGT